MKRIILWPTVLLFSTLVLANEKQTSLPISCHSIPNYTDSLCVVSTASPDMPVNDVVFYRQNDIGRFVFLEAIKGDVAHVFVKNFSTGGKYIITGYAEEGHPSFIVYETDTFLFASRPIKSVALISNYFITNILSLDDDGNAIIELMHSPSNIKVNESCIPTEQLPKFSNTDRCHIRYSIFNQP